MAMPHLAASGWVHATMPVVLCTTLLRLGHFMNSLLGGGYTDDVGRGMASLVSLNNVYVRVSFGQASEKSSVVPWRLNRGETRIYTRDLTIDIARHATTDCPISGRSACACGPARPLPLLLTRKWRCGGAESRAGFTPGQQGPAGRGDDVLLEEMAIGVDSTRFLRRPEQR